MRYIYDRNYKETSDPSDTLTEFSSYSIHDYVNTTGAGLNLNLATAAKGTFEATGNMLIKTDGNQVVTIAGTQGITATGHSTFNNNLRITGTTHSVGDVSTDAGNGPTMATHIHTITSQDTADGSKSGSTNSSTVADG